LITSRGTSLAVVLRFPSSRISAEMIATNGAALTVAERYGLAAPRLLGSDLTATAVGMPITVESAVIGGSAWPVVVSRDLLRDVGAAIAEVHAIKSCFGDHAKKMPVSSTKSMTGHLLGAAGGVEAIFSILAMQDGVIPPTINLDNPGEGCDLDFVPHTAREAKLDVVLSNSFGFGGTNGTLVFRRI
jgi:hypothetical protein